MQQARVLPGHLKKKKKNSDRFLCHLAALDSVQPPTPNFHIQEFLPSTDMMLQRVTLQQEKRVIFHPTSSGSVKRNVIMHCYMYGQKFGLSNIVVSLDLTVLSIDSYGEIQ